MPVKEIPIYRDDMFSEYIVVGSVLSLILAWVLSALDVYTGSVVALYIGVFAIFGALAAYTRRYALELGKGPVFPNIHKHSKPVRAVAALLLGILGIAASGLITSNLSFAAFFPPLIFSPISNPLLVVNTQAFVLFPAGGVVEQWGFERWLTPWLLEHGVPIAAAAPIKASAFTVYHLGVYGGSIPLQIYVFLSATVLAVMFWYSERQWPGYLAHGFSNMLAVLARLAAV